MVDNLKALSPVWRIVGPRLQKRVMGESAERTAEYLNRRRRQRLGIPEPVPEGCPPVDFHPKDCPKSNSASLSAIPLVLTGLVGLMMGAVLGIMAIKKKLIEI